MNGKSSQPSIQTSCGYVPQRAVQEPIRQHPQPQSGIDEGAATIGPVIYVEIFDEVRAVESVDVEGKVGGLDVVSEVDDLSLTLKKWTVQRLLKIGRVLDQERFVDFEGLALNIDGDCILRFTADLSAFQVRLPR